MEHKQLLHDLTLNDDSYFRFDDYDKKYTNYQSILLVQALMYIFKTILLL